MAIEQYVAIIQTRFARQEELRETRTTTFASSIEEASEQINNYIRYQLEQHDQIWEVRANIENEAHLTMNRWHLGEEDSEVVYGHRTEREFWERNNEYGEHDEQIAHLMELEQKELDIQLQKAFEAYALN